jgi:hypothetical protein
VLFRSKHPSYPQILLRMLCFLANKVAEFVCCVQQSWEDADAPRVAQATARGFQVTSGDFFIDKRSPLIGNHFTGPRLLTGINRPCAPIANETRYICSQSSDGQISQTQSIWWPFREIDCVSGTFVYPMFHWVRSDDRRPEFTHPRMPAVSVQLSASHD